jgi:hypothetical protein
MGLATNLQQIDNNLQHWPSEVDLIISALDAGSSGIGRDRRTLPRRPYRRVALLKLFADSPSAAPWEIFTRDANPRGLGFVTRQRLPLGYGGKLRLLSPDGEIVDLGCTVLRCRQTAGGWYDGALTFNQHQQVFDAPELLDDDDSQHGNG